MLFSYILQKMCFRQVLFQMFPSFLADTFLACNVISIWMYIILNLFLTIINHSNVKTGTYKCSLGLYVCKHCSSTTASSSVPFWLNIINSHDELLTHRVSKREVVTACKNVVTTAVWRRQDEQERNMMTIYNIQGMQIWDSRFSRQRRRRC